MKDTLTFIRRARNFKEAKDVEAYFEWFRMQYPKIIAYKTPNEGKRDPRFVKSGGILAGIPDIFIAKPVGSKHGLYIEMKPSDGSGKLQVMQILVMQQLREENYVAESCIGWEQAKDVTLDYLHGHYH